MIFLGWTATYAAGFQIFFSKSSINRKPPKHDKVAKVFLPSFNIFLITWSLKQYPNIFSKALAQKVWSLRGEEPSQVQSGNPASCVHFLLFLAVMRKYEIFPRNQKTLTCLMHTIKQTLNNKRFGLKMDVARICFHPCPGFKPQQACKYEDPKPYKILTHPGRPNSSYSSSPCLSKNGFSLHWAAP